MKAAKVVGVFPDRKEVSIFNPREPENKKTFTYDGAFDEDVEQSHMYEKSAFNIINNVIGGYNGTIFAYGQTGCGKTFSMMGVPGDERLKGIIPRSFSHIIGVIEEAKEKKFLVRVSFIELYNENIHDLLGPDTDKKMQLRLHTKKGMYIQDLTMPVVTSVEEMLKWMDQGDGNRHVGATAMNAVSSRSHSIFTVYIEVEESVDVKNSKIRAGKLNLVDLAGSERQSKTEAKGQRLKEANKINLSLSALGNVIAALVANKGKHIPYRDSKLTRLLEDSLGGNTKTLMIAAISPADDNYEETLSTLKYANRAKQIKNKPKINEDPKDTLLREYQDEIQKLKDQLKGGGGGKAGPGGIVAMSSMDKNKFNELQGIHGQLKGDEAKIQQDLQREEAALQQEKKKREELEAMLKSLQGNMVVGGQGNNVSNTEKENLKQMQANNDREEKMEGSQVNLQKKNTMEDITDDYDEMYSKFSELKKMYKQIERDVRDQEAENMREKTDILETLRFQEKELDFLRQIVKTVASNKELIKIKDKSTWEEDNGDYIIPDFYFKEKRELKNLPTLNMGTLPLIQILTYRYQAYRSCRFSSLSRKRYCQQLQSYYQE